MLPTSGYAVRCTGLLSYSPESLAFWQDPNYRGQAQQLSSRWGCSAVLPVPKAGAQSWCTWTYSVSGRAFQVTGWIPTWKCGILGLQVADRLFRVEARVSSYSRWQIDAQSWSTGVSHSGWWIDRRPLECDFPAPARHRGLYAGVRLQLVV